MNKKDWFPTEYLEGYKQEYKKVKINVGGQLFELSEILLRREPKSLLAALLDQDSPLNEEGMDGAVHVDRDWWIFRHIIHFLRTDSLPADALLLEELHNEANFYRLSSLKDAIERVDPRQLELGEFGSN